MRLLSVVSALIVSASLTVSFADNTVTNGIQSSTTESVATSTEKTVVTNRYYMEIQGIQNPLAASSFELRLVPGDFFKQYTKTNEKDYRTFCTRYGLKSMVDVMNLLSLYGWQLSQSYSIGLNGKIMHHWVIYKDASTVADLVRGIIEEK
jgi:hypothetical protein